MDENRVANLEDELSGLDFNVEDDRYRVEEIVQSQIQTFRSLAGQIDAFEKRPTSKHRDSDEFNLLVNDYNCTVDLINKIKTVLKTKLYLNNDQLAFQYRQLNIANDFQYYVSTHNGRFC